MPTFSLPPVQLPSLTLTGFSLPSLSSLSGLTQTGFSLPKLPNSPFLNTDDTVLDLVAITPPLTQQWGVYDLDGNPVFATVGIGGAQGNIDSFVSLKYDNNAKVSTFPVEKGQFASYNKTGTPFAPKVSVAVGGQDRIQALMETLEIELDTINLYQLITPERTYKSVTLEKYAYARTQKGGRNLLRVEMTFIQVIEVIPNQYSQTAIIRKPKKATAKDKNADGKVQADPLNAYKKEANAARAWAGRGNGFDPATGKRIR